MNKTKWRLLLLGILFVVIGCMLAYFYWNFRVEEKFTPVPLDFDPYNSSSTYQWDQDSITVQGGFVKGKVRAGAREELLVRSLCPEPSITLRGGLANAGSRVIRLENVDPLKIGTSNQDPLTIKDYHTISITLNCEAGDIQKVDFMTRDDRGYLEFVIMGDNRGGYGTFANIIEQINAISPVFTIDNGDLVFGGKPNQYRLFYQTVSKLQVPLYTTLGNHDIRADGREIYTGLFGPPYYSFDYRNSHIIILDSSRGWAEETAIPEEQYVWLETDLKKAQGKQIMVISHVPPTDPRSNSLPNTLPDIPGVHETSSFEKLMNDYTLYKNLNHSFPDPQEARRFEGLMAQYQVDTVFLSHIHSYFSYLQDGVRYIISGGAGAELLTQDSYYHYIRVKVNPGENYLEIIQLPSPANKIQDRYGAAIELFATSIYREYRTIIWAVGSLTAIFAGWLIWSLRQQWFPWLVMAGVWLVDVFKYARLRFKELHRKFKSRE